GRRLSRRGVIRGAGVGALGIAAWGAAGCAAASAPPTAPAAGATSPPATSGPAGAAGVPSPTPARATPKYGGKFTSMATASGRDLDPHGGGLTNAALSAGMCYSGLLTFKWGSDAPPPSYLPVGDL